jgi:hypothetical protein
VVGQASTQIMRPDVRTVKNTPLEGVALGKCGGCLQAGRPVKARQRATLIDQFTHATSNERAALLAQHDAAAHVGWTRARELVIGLWWSTSPGVH